MALIIPNFNARHFKAVHFMGASNMDKKITDQLKSGAGKQRNSANEYRSGTLRTIQANSPQPAQARLEQERGNRGPLMVHDSRPVSER
jgi:hypothetical protein